jgi:hypothetical protein
MHVCVIRTFIGYIEQNFVPAMLEVRNLAVADSLVSILVGRLDISSSIVPCHTCQAFYDPRPYRQTVYTMDLFTRTLPNFRIKLIAAFCSSGITCASSILSNPNHHSRHQRGSCSYLRDER